MEIYIGLIQLFFITLAIWSVVWFCRAVWKDAAGSPYLGLILLAVLVAVLGAYISANVFPENGVTGWDEARNLLRALIIERDIKGANLVKLWQDTNAQTIWGPGYAWLLAAAYIIIGESSRSAVILSLTLFLAGAILLYRICIRLDPEKGWIAGLVSASLMLSAPYAIHLSVSPMLEQTVAFLLLLAVLARSNAGTPFSLAVFSLLTAFLFLTKYNYALLFLISTAFADSLEILSDYRGNKEMGEKVKRILIYGYGPFLLVAVAWFSVNSANKTGEFLSFVVNVPRVESSPLGSYSLIFYPRLFLSAYSVFPWLPILMFPFLITGVWLSRSGAARRISILFLVSFLGIAAHEYKDTRFLVPILPFFWLFASIGLVESLGRIKKIKDKFPAKTAEAVIILFFIVVIPFKVCSSVKPQTPYYYSEALSRNPVVTESITSILRLVQAETSEGRSLAVWGTFAELSPALIEWHLDTTIGKEGKRYEYLSEPPGKKVRNIEERISSILRHRSVSLVSIQVDVTSPFYHDDYLRANSWQLGLVNALAIFHDKYGLKLRGEKVFREVGVTVRVYGPKET